MVFHTFNFNFNKSVTMWKTLVFLLIVGASALPQPRGGPKCGYESCTASKEGMLNVHIVPHTHDDVGWLKTVDQYYYGSRNDIQKAGVQYILDSVIKELWENPERRFIYVETAFFWKWWEVQPGSIKQKVYSLVDEGRLKFVGGAWSMNDEANTYYQTTIDQFTWGLRKLNETFGACGRPTVGWQIDPFGHSREFASLLAGMGYDGLFLGRIDYQDKQNRLKDKTMEMVWRGDDTVGAPSDIFTGVLYNTYSPPPGFCFDVLCQDEPIIDDPNSPDYNVVRRIEAFFSRVRQMALAYATNNILVTMGDDFQYQDAGMWFKNLDKLILYGNLKAVNDDLNINLFYSTPDCYLKSVKDAKPTLPTKQDDFFPYASDPHSFWTGYFTSRPTVKYLEAQTNTYLQVVKQLQVLAYLPDENMSRLDELRGVMGVMQHHDAVTGTEKQHVAKDYVRMVTKAVNDAHHIPTAALNKVMKIQDAGSGLVFDRCQFNESSCRAAEEAKGDLLVMVYNPLAWEVTSPISIPVVGASYDCNDGKGNSIPVQMTEIPDSVLKIPTRDSIATKEATFIAKLPALGYKGFYLSLAKEVKRDKRSVKFQPIDIEEYFNNIKHVYTDIKNLDMDSQHISDEKPIESVDEVIKLIPDEPTNDKYKYKVSPDSEAKLLLKTKGANDRNVEEFGKVLEGDKETPKRSRHLENPYNNMGMDEMRMLADDPMVVTRYPDDEMADETLRAQTPKSQQNLRDCLRIEPMYYAGVVGNNMVFQNRSSGAYIFRPDTTEPNKLDVITNTKITGELFDETRQTLSKNVAYTQRKYKKDIEYIEIDWIVGPIPIEDGIGKEFIMKYKSDMINNGEFFTDSNGRQMLKRILNKRPQWDLKLQEPVAGNYYPVTDAIGIKGGDCSMTVLPDRAVGGSSLEEGSIEVMLHRRLLHDDAFGVGEALNETLNGTGLVARGTNRVYMCTDVTFKEILENRLRPQAFVADVKDIDIERFKGSVSEFSWLKKPLAAGVHLLTLEPWSGSKLLLRLENYVENTKEVDLSNILKGINVINVKETVLAANHWAEDDQSWSWDKTNEFADDFNKEFGSEERPRAKKQEDESDNDFVIKLKGKQIRTFIIDYEQENN